jgi:hypothetical protein
MSDSYAWPDFRREFWDAVNADRLGDDLPSKSDLAYDAELDREGGR